MKWAVIEIVLGVYGYGKWQVECNNMKSTEITFQEMFSGNDWMFEFNVCSGKENIGFSGM